MHADTFARELRSSFRPVCSQMPAVLSLHALLEQFLNTPPRVCCTCRETYSGHTTGHSRIRTHRYIRVLRGSLTYTVGQTSARLSAGTIFFVPRGAARVWDVPRGRVCEMLWCEFLSPGVDPDPHTLYYADDSRRALEKAALLRMLRLWKFPQHLRDGDAGDPAMPRETALVFEGELKASLARFWTAARPWDPRSMAVSPDTEHVHPSVARAIVWLEENFHRPEAHRELYEETLDISPNHFRLLFHKYTGASVSAHLSKLRMAEAMNLLRTTSKSVKEVAAAVGFRDPLYFSRRFHEVWQIPPTAVRK